MEKITIKNKDYFKFTIDANVNIFDPSVLKAQSNELKASLLKLSGLLPDINYDENYDLVPMACDAFVANYRNKNNQVIGTEKALEIAENFKFKFIDVEHNREKVVGVILTVGFSTFGEDSQPITKEELEGTDQPFNVSVGGVLWPVVNGNVADVVEDSSNVLSEHYKKISASWELLCSDFDIALFDKGDYVLSKAELDKDKIYAENLYTNGGSGKTKDGLIVCNLIKGDTLPVGIGLTTDPAAFVKGVLAGDDKVNVASVNSIKIQDIENSHLNLTEKIKEFEEKIKNLEEQRVIASEKSVKKDKSNNILIMTIKDITDESLKDLKANQIHDFIKSELERAAGDFSIKQKEKEEELKNTQESFEAAQKEQAKLKEDYEKLEAEINRLKSVEAERIAQEKFDSRMELIESSYEVTESAKSYIAQRLNKIDSDEDFASYQSELASFLSPKSSEDKGEGEEGTTVVAQVLEASKSDNKSSVNNSEVSDDAVKAVSVKIVP